MSKLWLCGMFRGDKATLEKSLSHIIDYFDGLIAVVDDRITSDWNTYKKQAGLSTEP